jgi:uncharacterized protein with beta-barrel porin domain
MTQSVAPGVTWATGENEEIILPINVTPTVSIEIGQAYAVSMTVSTSEAVDELCGVSVVSSVALSVNVSEYGVATAIGSVTASGSIETFGSVLISASLTPDVQVIEAAGLSVGATSVMAFASVCNCVNLPIYWERMVDRLSCERGYFR